MMKNAVRCLNFNHGRSNAPIRACPMCGVIVNGALVAGRCTEVSHAERRRKRDAFCMDCGAGLKS